MPQPPSSQTVGLIGAGGISHMHLPGWLSLGYRVVVFSLDGQAPAITKLYGGEVADSLADLLDQSDIVDVCTPTNTHRELVERAAAAGRHVVCEKPLALTVDECEAMIAACDRAGVRLFPAHVVRYFPAYATMRDAVASGSLGELAVQRYSRAGAAPSQPWFSDVRLSGGIAMDQMIHDLDFSCWLAGPVDSAYATQAGGGAPGAPTTVQAVLRHQSGVLSHVNGVWGAPSLPFHTSYQVAGTGGLVEHDSLEHPILGIEGLSRSDDAGYLPPVHPSASPYTAELADFARAIRTGAPARVCAEDGVQAVRVAAAVNRSLIEGRPVTLTTDDTFHTITEDA